MWDSEVKDKISSRRKVYKNVLDGNVDAWEVIIAVRTSKIGKSGNSSKTSKRGKRKRQ